MATNTKSAATKKAVATAVAEAVDTTKFPRKMQIVNNTARPWVIGGTYVAPSSTAEHPIQDADALTRDKEDCLHLLGVSDHYKPKEGADPATHALRIEELSDDEAAEASQATGDESGATA